MVKNKERTTINFDAEVYAELLKLRGKPEYARKSVSALVNMLLVRALAAEDMQRREA